MADNTYEPAPEFAPRKFRGDPNPAPDADNLRAVPRPQPVAPAEAHAVTPGKLNEGAPIPSATQVAPKPKGTWTVVDELDGPLKMYLETPDGELVDFGEVKVPGARDVLAAHGEYNEATRSYTLPEEAALPLKDGAPGIKDFVHKMWDTGEAGTAEGMIGWKGLTKDKTLDDAVSKGDIELLKMLQNDFPSELWKNTDPAAIGASFKWALGATVKALPSLKGGVLAGAEASPMVAASAVAGASFAGPAGWAALASPAGFAAIVSGSASYGMFDFTTKVTAGSIALDMKRKGMNEDTIRKIAPIAGMMAGALEIAHVKYLPAPARRLFVQKVLGNEAVKAAMGHWLKNYFIEVGMESSVEGAQQMVEEYAKNFGAMLDKKPELMKSHTDILKASGAAMAEAAVAFAGMKAPGVAIDYRGSRLAKANVKALKAAIAAGEFDATTASVAKIEGLVNPEIDASKLNEILKKPEGAQAYGKKNAGNEEAKAAVHAKTEALKIKYVATTEGKTLSELPEETQAEVLNIAGQMSTLNSVVEAMDATRREEPMVPQKEPRTVAEAVERRYAEQGAVLKKLDRDSKALESERAEIEAEIVERIKDQRPTAALDAAASRLTQKIMANDALALEVHTTPALMSETLGEKLSAGGVEGIMSAAEIVRAERDTEERIAAAKESFFKHGASYAKREVHRVQSYIQELVNRSGMEKADREKFIGILRNTKTVEQLEANYPGIRDRIFVAEEVRRAKASEQIIAKALKAGKVKNVGGKPTGKFGDADTQAIVTVVNATNKMTRSQALLETNAAETAYTIASDESHKDYSPAGEAKAFYALQAARFRAGQMSTEEGAAFVSDLTNMLSGARAAFIERREAERAALKEETRAMVAEGLGSIVPPEGWDKSRVEPGSWVKGLQVPRGLIGLYAKGLASMSSIAHIISFRSGKKKFESFIEKVFSAHKEETKFDGLKLHWHERLTEAIERAYNITGSVWQKAKTLRRLQKRLLTPYDLGTFKNAGGQQVNLTYSIDEAIKFYMELQDPSLAENITNPTAMAYTPEMINAVSKLLSDGDKRFAMAQLQLYRDLYKDVNKVFREVRGVDLPFNDFYSPIQVLNHAGKAGSEMAPESAADQVYEKSTLGSWGISRVRHLRPLAKQSSLSAYNDHVYAVTRYIAYEAKVRKWNAILADSEFKAMVVGVYGDEVYNGLQTTVRNITKGSHERAIMRGLDRVITKLIVAEIVGKPLAIAKQLTSMPAFANAVPLQDLPKFAREFAATMRHGFSKEWLNSDFVRSRGSNVSQELRATLEYSKKGGGVLNDPRIVENMAVFVKFGDQASILIGGDALFRYLRKQGKSTAEAIEIASQTARETQSSGSIIDLSPFQAQGGATRLFTAYMNQPIQFIRLEVQALTDMASKGFLKGEGRISRLEAIKTIVLFHVILPSLFQMVVDAGWDEEKQKRAVILGSFNSVPLLANLVSKLYHLIAHEEGVPMGAGSVWDSWQRDVIKGIEAFSEADDAETYAEALELLANPTFKVLWGIPTKPFMNMARGLGTIAEGDSEDFLDAFKLAAGYSPYMIDEQNRRN